MSTRMEIRTIRIGTDGSLDPNALANMGEHWILSWLRDRLAGNDPYFPLDHRIDEDPDAKLVALVRSAGPLHLASREIGRASLQLLKEAAERPAEPPTFFASLLRVCQRVELLGVEPWFSEFVRELAQHPQETEAQWGRGPTLEVLYAALQQLRGARSPRLRASWRRLLTYPEYTTHALVALSPSFEEEMKYLAAWWNACPPRDRRRELRQGITRAWKLEGTERLREILSGKWSALPTDLRGAINQILTGLKLAPIAPHSAASVRRAIANAGQRHEFVLSRETECYATVHDS